MKLEAQAQIRTAVGKGVARQTRREGKIPGILYGQGKSLPISMDPAIVRRILLAQGGSTALITLQLQGEGGKTENRITVIQDFQRDPITGHILHVDLFEVSMNKSVKVKVHVHITGETPIGVKRDKGILHHGARELHIECLPGEIPDQIEVDASNLEINQGIHVRDLQPGSGVKILDDAELMVVNVAVPISDAKLAAMLTGEAGEAEAAEAAVAPGTSPAAEKGKTAAAPAAGKPGEGKK